MTDPDPGRPVSGRRGKERQMFPSLEEVTRIAAAGDYRRVPVAAELLAVRSPGRRETAKADAE